MLYLVAPANVYTGGPTAIYQLCHSLRTLFGYPAVMALEGVKDGIDPVHPNYKKFECPWIPLSRVEDRVGNTIIIPESLPHLILRFPKSRKVIYWLSVDHFILSWLSDRHSHHLIYGLFNSIEYCLKSIKYCLKNVKLGLYRPIHYATDIARFVSTKGMNKFLEGNKSFLEHVDLHFAQSVYSMNFLLQAGVDKNKILILREPLEDHFLNYNQLNLESKTDLITVNSRKAFSITYQIISKIKKYDKKNVKVVPLQNVGREKMFELLSRSKVFIDIGFHPGRDRPPREAGVLGNIVVINRSGGCYYYEDCPVPDKYAITCNDVTCRDIDPARLAQLIIDYVNNYDDYINDFKNFIELIRKEPDIYMKDLEVITQRLINET